MSFSSSPPRTIVVIGGGIAGTSCIEALLQDYGETNPYFNRIVLISENKLLKKVINYAVSGRNLERFDVGLASTEEIFVNIPHHLKLDIIIGTVCSLNTNKKLITYETNQSKSKQHLNYHIVCICTGSRPRQLPKYTIRENQIHKRTIVIRDTHTVEELKEKLSQCRRLIIVGNGGISLELVGKIEKCQKIWIIRDESIGLTFFDSGAGKFLLDASTGDGGDLKCKTSDSRDRFSSTQYQQSIKNYGPALGPNWLQDLKLEGAVENGSDLEIVYKDEVEHIEFNDSSSNDYPLTVTTTKKRKFKCDFIALALGVSPNFITNENNTIVTSGTDGGILIDEQMRTSASFVYAAGDVVSCENWSKTDLWFQMRLWTQARKMGYFAGKSIGARLLDEDPSIYFTFECFTHCTTFFGYKVVLLGRFNGQGLDPNVEAEKYDVVARVNSSKDYVKILINHIDGRIIGSVIVGESGLEETIENLIYDKIDVSGFKEQLLDNTVDIEDYFD